MGAIFSSAASCIIYRYIILPRKQSNDKKTRMPPIVSPYLVGFGIVMPLCAVSPYYYLRYFGIKNKIIKFLAGVAQLTSFFRCSEGKSGGYWLSWNTANDIWILLMFNLYLVNMYSYVWIPTAQCGGYTYKSCHLHCLPNRNQIPHQ